ncbi:MAG: ROK family protein [Patescibacteria group bacterium]|jgi:predicted NBD/HSP70 family sugar kinase
MSYALVLDIGATKIAGALIKEPLSLKSFKIVKSSSSLLDIANFAKDIKKDAKISSIGLSIAGQIDAKSGIIVRSPNFPKNFKNIKIKKILQDKFKVPVYLDNDANCFALGEAVYGAGKKYKNLVGITLGTGVGGGIIIDKKIYHGKNNLAGEFGHMLIQNKIWEKNKNNIKKTSCLSDALYNILHVLDPEIIIIGGGISQIPGLIAKARQNLKKLIYYQALKTTPIVKSQLNIRANLLGAYLLTKSYGK